jgi:hypothetical protein
MGQSLLHYVVSHCTVYIIRDTAVAGLLQFQSFLRQNALRAVVNNLREEAKQIKGPKSVPVMQDMVLLLKGAVALNHPSLILLAVNATQCVLSNTAQVLNVCQLRFMQLCHRNCD